MMSPQAMGKSPGRNSLADVRESIGSVFKQLGSQSCDNGKITEITGNWEADIGSLVNHLDNLHLETIKSARSIKLYSIKDEEIMGLTASSEERARKEIINALHEHLEPVEDGSWEQIDGHGHPAVSAILGTVSRLFHQHVQHELKHELIEQHAERVSKAKEVCTRLRDSIKASESRLTGVTEVTTTANDTHFERDMQQFKKDSFALYSENHSVTELILIRDGMIAARDKLRRSTSTSSKRWMDPNLTADQIEKMAGKSTPETKLDKRIDEITIEINAQLLKRNQSATDLLGGGTVNMKPANVNVSALKKLKDAKLDKMDMEPDSRTATLIRAQVQTVVKQNITSLWALAAMAKLIGSSNLVGKDFYIMKNNDLIKKEQESDGDFLARLEGMGFKPALQDEGTNNLNSSVQPGAYGEAVTPQAIGRQPEPEPSPFQTAEGETGKRKLVTSESDDDGDYDRDADRVNQIHAMLTAFTDANGELYNLLLAELPDAVNSAVEKSGHLFGNNVQDSRVNSAARGDGLSVFEAWIFAAERFGDAAREQAHDFVRHGAGWLVQNNWKGGIETLRLGITRAIDSNVEVTYTMSIARYMQALYTHRPTIALQMKDEYGQAPTDRTKNVIYDVPAFLGRVSMLIEQQGKEERRMKNDKGLRDARALLVRHSHNFATSVVDFDAGQWDEVDQPEYMANFTKQGDGQTGGNAKRNSSGTGDDKWKMWKHPAATFTSGGKRCCDNQSCENELSNAEYKKVCDKQKAADAKGKQKGFNRGLPSWEMCGDCATSMKSNPRSCVYPDGYFPGLQQMDRNKAVSSLQKRFKANAAKTVDPSTISPVQAEDEGMDDDTMSVVSSAEIQAEKESLHAERIAFKDERISDLQSAHAAQAARIKQLEDEAARSVRGRGESTYRRMHMDDN
jgi:hypothetical protein